MEQKTDKVYQQVIDYISCLIKEGILKKGDKIPTERDLSVRFGVSRNSIREALKILEVIGLVVRRQGDGTFIKEQFDDCLTEPLSMVFMLEEIGIDDIFQFRNMIEVQTVVLAASRITDAEIQQLEMTYQNMIRETDDVNKAKYDIEFHHIIAKASRNVLILNSYNVMSSLMGAFINNIRIKVLEGGGTEEVVSAIHKKILEALKSRDPQLAEVAIKEHMEVINSMFKQV
ncbi:FadR/GntR family transcriptional regulator [Alkaliphilus metalliredigens]|nr:FadR/GntR family transcriptional regulator [Alkaliphilus metalliredigens]